MGMMGMFKWLRKDNVQRDRSGWNSAQKQCGLNNESYRNALQAFIDRRRPSDDTQIEAPCSPDKSRADYLAKNNNNKCDNERKSRESKLTATGLPHIAPSEIFEIGWVAGTEDRYLELIFAEWQNTRVSLKRHSHPECKDAVKADLDVLSEVRHPNVLLLMASTFTDEHGLISIFESIDCTLYHYIHDQGERIPIQGIAKCGGRLSDALRHAHMRGYVHTAISSHCVYLASNGLVKLGGWELAMHIDSPKPDREYEERLRTEIYRWQAPELFVRYEPHTESDVYGLTLLIWEMCTMHVPWSGYSKADVERQYSHWKRGVITDLYDFPPLLHNLLDAGLQLDFNKRTLDMNRMRRFLQRLEMQYEDEDPVYVDQSVNNNNNNETGKTCALPETKSPKNKPLKLTKSLSAKQLSCPTKNTESSLRQYLHSRKSMPKRNANLKAMAHIEQMLDDDIKCNAREDLQKNMNAISNMHINYKKTRNHPNFNQEILDTDQYEESNAGGMLQPWNSTYRKVKAPQEIESRTTSVYSSPLIDSTDDESYKDARTNLQQLKKTLACKREHFFYGSDSSHASTNLSSNTNKIITEVRSKDYEPHKPASHKTSFEPKYNKSPSQYDPSYTKSTYQEHHKVPYLHTPDSIRGAIVRSRVLNSDPQSFFETSLWRKEKLICLSKMRKTCANESYLVQHPDDNDTGSTETIAKSPEPAESVSVSSDNTYVIRRQSDGDSQEGFTQVSKNTKESPVPDDSQNEPLQVLKDALDRATEIVRTVSPSIESCTSPSPSFKCDENFEERIEDNEANRSVFEELYNLHTDSDDTKIETIERSTTGNKTFLVVNSNESDLTSDDMQNESSSIIVSVTSFERADHSHDVSSSRNFVCESIAEVSSELNVSYNDTVLPEKDDPQSPNDEIISIQENNKASENVQSAATMRKDVEAQVEIKEESNLNTPVNSYLMLLNDSMKNKDCKSCHLTRRRSLPATLSQLKSLNNSTLGKLPIRRGGILDNTVEDLYIDDEFGDTLNVNMLLLNEDLSIDEDFLSEISDILKMLNRQYARVLWTQIFERKTVCNPLQFIGVRTLYNNHEAVMHFIRYLRKRQITVGTDSLEKKWNDTTERPPDKMFFKFSSPKSSDFLTFHWKDWWKQKKDEFLKFIEKRQYEQYVKSGPDIAAAKFVIEFGGKVRFKGHDEWLDKTKKKVISQLPKDYDETYILEELDLNKYPLRYEHLHFICNLYYLRSLSLKGCKSIDDWALDKLSAEFPSLEYLDISECENVTERGIEALYRMPNLKKLIVTNYHGSAAFDLTCFMLEDINPYLTCLVQQAKIKTLPQN
ncbi:uncharacterized protein LOC108629038 [Ceratina calcarata]|uniref:Uncharacterized protein LOC108629038 n=1 Tax=Ceratina calcarata TaxID=156304 RepID=A0AAJ7NBE0_9HYME|nr:uncharacterized protein LOC108629038 [Ceratina calcarata]